MLTTRIRNRLPLLAIFVGALALAQLGCDTKSEPSRTAEQQKSAVISEYQDVARTTLGKQAEVVAQGAFTNNGRMQLLAVDRASVPAHDGNGVAQAVPLIVTRAAILEKNRDKWVEVLLCDEHLKNSHGYLRGTPVNPVNGWKLEFKSDSQQGLDLLFTPMNVAANQSTASNEKGSGNRPVEVRWNNRTDRYQSLDASGDVFLEEGPTLEIPQSILR